MNRWIDNELDDPVVRNGLAIIASLVRQGRRGAGITQQQLAWAAEVHQSTISRLERGHLRAMRLVRLARVVGTLVDRRGLAPPGRTPRRDGTTGWHGEG
jgi:DNA-binding XRE family transcriptional regulator